MADDPTPSAFDELVDPYDSLIDWPKRLANEGPFFKRLFAEAGMHTVLDAACGTGHHAAMFRGWGLTVEGADLSPAMIARCRERFGENEGLSWAVRSFTDARDTMPSVDAVVCIGNSLALVDDLTGMHRAVRAMIAKLRPGGIGIFQVLNLWRIPEGPTIWQKCESRPSVGGHRVVLKGLHRVAGRGYVDLIDLRLTPGGLVKRFDAPSFIGLEAAELSHAIQKGGGSAIQLLGGYGAEPYDREKSADLMCVFRK